jgi:hypothetical protein
VPTVAERTRFVVTFAAAPGNDGLRALRSLLKAAGRRHDLRCIDVREENPNQHDHPHGVRPPRRAGFPEAAGSTSMSLGQRKSSNFMPVLKYDARAGTFYLQDRVLGPNGYVTEQRDVTDAFTAIFDLEQVERGWIHYPKGAPPDLHMVRAGEDPGEAPSKDHKEGIRLTVKMVPELGGSVRELQSTSLAMWTAIEALHNAWESQAAAHPNQVPVVKMVDVVQTETPNGSTFTPTLEICDWVPRPVDLPLVPAGLRKSAKPVKPAKPAQARGRDSSNMDDEIPF